MSLIIVHLIIKPYGFTAHVWEPPACTAPGLQQETWLGVRVVPKHAPGTATVGVIFREHTLWIFRRGRDGGGSLFGMLHRAHALPGLAALAVSWGAHVRLSAEFLFARAAVRALHVSRWAR